MRNNILKNNTLNKTCLILFLWSVFHIAVSEEVKSGHEIIEEGISNHLNKINELVELGVPELALRFIESKQPMFKINQSVEWLWWEQKRIQLLQRLRRWDNIVLRVNKQKKLWSSDEVENFDKNWFLTQRVKAHQKLNQHKIALSQLQKMLWNINGHIDAGVVSVWRHLIIRSYMNLDKIEDAQRAMRRYLQDYDDVADEKIMSSLLCADVVADNCTMQKVLQAQLLMRTGRFKEVVQLLSQAETIEEDAMLLVAKIKANVISTENVILQADEELLDESVSEEHGSVYHYALLLLAIKNNDLKSQIETLENLLSKQTLSYLESVFSDVTQYVSADHLWQAYISLGFELSNQDNLLRGDDEAWYLKAGNLFDKKPLYAKSLYAVLAFNARQDKHKKLAFQQLAKILDKNKSSLEILNKLFMKSRRIDDIEKIPVTVRYRLVDYALSHADLISAAKLMKKLQQPPAGEDVFAWGLRRARILVLGGRYEEGLEVLNSLINASENINSLQIDQYMQVIFDLQNVQQHGMALAAFSNLDKYPLNQKLLRELAYWKAESFQSQQDYEQSAYLYLKSAKPLGDSYDLWYHTASFKAAESLAQAGLIDDARRRYVNLLNITTNTARKAVIQQRLQQLRLQQSKQLQHINFQTQ